MPIEVIGAGFGRTGTKSMKTAFDILGYKPYHMEDAVFVKDHMPMWSKVYAKPPEMDKMDWEFILDRQGYTATLDFPICLHYEELMHRYPDAKVILSTRDPEKWFYSFKDLMGTVMTAMRLTQCFLSVAWHMLRLHRGFIPDFDKYKLNKPVCIQWYNDHEEAVKKIVPPERLLIWNVKDGWEPMCKFLGKPIPAEPFPHDNAGMAYIRQKILSFFYGGTVENMDGKNEEYRKSREEGKIAGVKSGGGDPKVTK